MKTTKGNNTKQSKQGMSTHLPKPAIRDTMDSRKEREEGFTGDISKKGDRKKKHK